MQNQVVILFAFALGFVSAMPNPLAKRQVVNSPAGNIKIQFSDSIINPGSVTTDAIMDQLTNACNEQGTCETTPISMSGQLLSTDDVEDIVVTVNPSGDYPTWIHNGLLDVLRASVKAVANCSQVTYVNNCNDSPYYCPNQPETVTQCTVPQYWAVNYQDPSASDAAPPYLAASMSVAVVGDGLCGDLLGILGAVAGAVNGVAGGIFSLLSLACQS